MLWTYQLLAGAALGLLTLLGIHWGFNAGLPPVVEVGVFILALIAVHLLCRHWAKPKPSAKGTVMPPAGFDRLPHRRPYDNS